MTTAAARKRVLVVEDDYGVARAVQLLLRHSGFEPLVAESVREAMKQLANEPEWVILDLMLPDGCGIEVLRAIRARGLRTKVVVASGTGDDKLIADVVALAPEHYLVKPVEFSKLLSALR